MKYVFKYFTVFCLFLGILYGGIILVLPKILNSEMMVKRYENILSLKLNSDCDIKGFKFSISPKLAASIQVKEISAENSNGVKFVDIKDLNIIIKFFKFIPDNLSADKIYINYYVLKDLFNTPSPRKISGSYENFPSVNINRIYVKLDNEGSFADIKDIKSYNIDRNKVYDFYTVVKFPYLKKPVEIGKKGNISYKEILSFNNLLVNYDNAEFYILGNLRDLSLKGNNLPVRELEEAFLYFYKFKHPNKKNFIENFQNFSGTLNIDLKLLNGDLQGTCTANNLSADFSKFKIPVKLSQTVFYFKNRGIKAAASGTFGGEPVYTDFFLSGLASKNLKVTGNVKSNFTNSFAKRYFKLVHISGITNAEVHYQVQNSQVDIDYNLEIPKGSNILSKFGNIDNISVDRLISAHTVKNGDSIKISEYKYEFLQSDKSKWLLLKGNGLFTKLSGSYKPVYFTLKTNEKVNLSLIKSFIRNTLQGGYFTADLKCDFLKKKVTGFLNVYKTSFKNVLCLDNVNVLLSENLVEINADGTFYDSPICLDFSADNNFDDIMIHNIDIILERFYIKRGNSVSTKSFIVHNEINKNLNLEQNMTIKKGRIHVKEIASSKCKLYNVEMLADMHNGLVRFTIPQTAYAKGILMASGKYNLFNHSSDINFAASDIDSNEVASSLFNLHDQIEGSAFATLHLITLNKLNDIKAYATFAVNDGSLPKLGSKEFIISGSKTHKVLFFLKKPFKFTLSKISNIDFSNPDIVSSDLNGSFFLDNNDIKNVKIFSKNEFLSLFIEGNYNIVNENGRLYIWGRHNRIEEKKIKIFKIPLSFIYKVVFRKEKSKHLYQDKIKQIPSINAKPEEEALFRVFVNGNINTNDVKVILKDLK